MNEHRENPFTLAIACGGTGGHFYPGLTIAKEFERRGGKAILFIAGHQLGNQVNLAADEKVAAVTTKAFKIPRRNLYFPIFGLRFTGAILAHLRLLHRHRVNAVLCMGSYASAPLGFAAVAAGKPLILHEGNAVLGRTNRFLARWARVLTLSFSLKDTEQIRTPQQIVGMPLRESIVRVPFTESVNKPPEDMYRQHNLKYNLPTLLVFGGSQGAERINQLMMSAILQLKPEFQKFQVIHLTGRDDNSELIACYREKGLSNVVKKRDDYIKNLYQMADLIFCRAGASTIFELAYFAKPAIYLPIANSVGNHQRENVSRVLEADGGILLKETRNTVQDLLALIERWLTAPEEFYKKGRNLRKLARPNTTKNLVDTILTYSS